MFESPTNKHEIRPKNSKESFEYLRSLLSTVSNEISAELRDKYKVEGLIDETCSISMEAFKPANPAIYEKDLDAVKQSERRWSGVENPNTRAF